MVSRPPARRTEEGANTVPALRKCFFLACFSVPGYGIAGYSCPSSPPSSPRGAKAGVLLAVKVRSGQDFFFGMAVGATRVRDYCGVRGEADRLRACAADDGNPFLLLLCHYCASPSLPTADCRLPRSRADTERENIFTTV